MNKWWSGLLEMLSGKSSQSITGSDRPVYLEAIVAIMARPEWRIPHMPPSSTSTPTAAQPSNSTSRSTTSVESSGSEFLVESIHHNIRNVFSQNLLSQLAYVIDRMSLRHAPASLVSFGGKTCAYAFFFCPEIPDMLVRLWGPSPNCLRRVIFDLGSDENPLLRRKKSEEVSSHFPRAVQSLRFLSHAATTRQLRRKAVPPLGALNVNWFGPWLSRWSGRETDLFFVFVKSFYILVSDFLPAGSMKSDRLYVPGVVHVHSQLLTVLESTLNKQSSPQPVENAPNRTASVTFDDFIDGDANATAMPLGAANSLRAMSDNRLVMLLKEVIADNSMRPGTKQMLVESLCAIVKVAARKTSLFDHNACFILCDFVEELITIIPPYCETTNQPDLLDWDFWLDVCKQMLESNNYLTEVRVFSFIYSTWDVIIVNDARKEQLCLGLLLEDSIFHRYFSHWNSMVRAYFQRLLCWRLARFFKEPLPLNK